ncbi:MAG: FAD-dependent oxidoreductase [Burkholderiaceae bacterium]
MAVIGAGIVGVTTAYELLCDGHEVTMFERRSSVAVESSFANAGLLAPGYVTPWAAPGMLRKVLRQWGRRDAAVRLAGFPNPALGAWLWRWWQACDPAHHVPNRAAMLALATRSLARTRALSEALGIEYERARGLLVLLRSERELAASRAGLRLLAELEVGFHVVDAAVCRRIEPALDASTELRAGIHLPSAEVGNCRQFALALKAELQRRGATLKFSQTVERLTPATGDGPQKGLAQGVDVTSWALAPDAESAFAGAGAGAVGTSAPGERQHEHFDAVVVCAALQSQALLRPLGLRLPLQPVFGYSITLPVRHFEAHPDVGPFACLMDERYKVAITRLGDRVRVAGGAELGGVLTRHSPAPIATLHRVLQDWFPSAAHPARAQTWKGARPMLPDGPPAIGACGVPGVWLNTGHGSSGWALACGSAQLVAEALAGRPPSMDTERFSPLRWRS